MKNIEAALLEPRDRITGVVYLLYFLTAVLAQYFVARKLVVYGEVVNGIAYGLYIVLTLLFYFLFKPVNRMVSLIAAICSLAGCTLGVLDLFHVAPSHVSPLFFFGAYCLLIGSLIVRSTFLPRAIGWLMVFAGVGWLAFLFPAVARHLSIYIEGLGILAEVSLMLWLLVMGVNVQRWKHQASAARAPLEP
jgi:Domain of unknown function (DUF4386)